MNSTARKALAEATLYSDGVKYKLVQLPANAITLAAGIVAEAASPFTSIIADKDEVSLVLPLEVCQAFERRLSLAAISDLNYRMLTFDVVLEPNLVGFLALIIDKLAEAQVPVLAFAAYSRDHIFVPAGRFDDAIAAVESMRESTET